MSERAMAYVKTRRAGASLVVTLPRELAKLLGLREGEVVRIKVQRPNRSYFGAFPGLSRFKPKERANHRD